MDTKTAVKGYQFAERTKSELIICSQLVQALPGFPEQERPGGRRMVLLLLDAVRAEAEIAYRSSGIHDFRRAIDRLSEAISATESSSDGAAAMAIAEAISAVTTAAQASWEHLTSHGLL